MSKGSLRQGLQAQAQGHGAAVAALSSVELRQEIARWMKSPECRGWIRLSTILDSAAADPDLMASHGAAQFVDVLRELVGNAVTARDADEVFGRLGNVLQAERAARRNADARAWVVREWEAHAAAYVRNKTEFARHYAARLRTERDVAVGERQIRDRWLKGR